MVKEPNMSYALPLTPEAQKILMNRQEQKRIEHIGAAIRANEQQVGGAHYAVKAIQPWDFIIANNIGYLEGNIIKYISRWKDKGGVEDLKKAQHYLQKLIETHDKERVV
jgi:hypothetical protein